MKVRTLMTADTVGGGWTFALELASALIRSGSHVELAAMGAPLTSTQRTEAEEIPRLRVHEGHFRLEWMEGCWQSVDQASAWLLDLERHVVPDVVHLNGYAHGALLWRAPVVITGHSCLLSRHAAVHGKAALATWDRYAEEVARGLRGAQVVTAPTRVMGDALKRHYGEDLSVRVIPNGRSFPSPPVIPKRHRVLTVGRLWDPAKNVAAMDRVAAKLSWPVVVAGQTRHPDGGAVRLKNARALGVLEPAALSRAYAGAAIFALPAFYEPFGYAPLEAALSGCALILGDIPSLREVWGNAACYVPSGDDQALIQTVRWMIDDRQVRRDYAKRAKERALTYTPERMAAGYLDAYRTALAEPTELLGARGERGALSSLRL